MKRRPNQGAVALEFLMLFPFVVAMLYAAAVYSIVFFTQYKMQSMVDRAVATALYVDRSTTGAAALKSTVEGRGLSALSGLVQAQTGALAELSPGDDACRVEVVGDLEMLRCALSYDNAANPIVPTMSFGMLGTFPPVPNELKAEAFAAF